MHAHLMPHALHNGVPSSASRQSGVLCVLQEAQHFAAIHKRKSLADLISAVSLGTIEEYNFVIFRHKTSQYIEGTYKLRFWSESSCLVPRSCRSRIKCIKTKLWITHKLKLFFRLIFLSHLFINAANPFLVINGTNHNLDLYYIN